VAASSSPGARGSQPAERYRLLRELGASVVPAWAALEALPDGRSRVLVVQRAARGGEWGDQEIADWVRDARRLATLEHPNVVRVRDVVIRGEEVLVAGDFSDGVRWSELTAQGPAERPSLEIALRVLVDVLSGLSAVHNLRDAKREPLKLVHGELTPDCVIVGQDGVARIAGASRPRSATARSGRKGSAYLAPEVLLADESADARADVYGVGVMLWEALSGKPLFTQAQPSAIVTQLLSGRVPRATVPDGAAWAAPLVDVAARALSADPQKRFASAAALAADIRRIAGAKLAPPVRVGAFIRGAWGERIRERREQLERGEVPPRQVSGIEAPPGDDGRVTAVPPQEIEPSSTIPTVPPEPNASTAPPPPYVGAVAEGPPPLPPQRPRFPTLSGVAPQGERDSEVPGAPLVVPSSSHPPPPPRDLTKPTPFVAFEVPSAALIPIEIAFEAAPAAPPVPAAAPPPRRDAPPPSGAQAPPIVTAVMPAVRSAPPAAVRPPVATDAAPPPPLVAPPLTASSASEGIEVPHPASRRRGLALLGLIAGVVSGTLAAFVWWLVQPAATGGAHARASAAPASSAASPPASTRAATSTAAPTADTSTVATAPPEPARTGEESAPTTPGGAPSPARTGSPTPTAPRAGAGAPVPAAPAYVPPPSPLPAPAKPPKRKYEPEGI
jgi:hypothetical protein